jgi:polysaccharide deacetylase family protein (PEP-CTERM system associated)
MSIPNAFTVDLEDWYHGLTSTNRHPDLWPSLESRVVTSTERVLDLLAVCDVRATFFVLGKVAEQYPDLVRRVAAAGHEIGVHGYAHQKIHRLTRTEFAAEIDQSLALLRLLTPDLIIGYRAPYFSIDRSTLWALDILAERGLAYDSSVFPTRNMLYGYPDAPRRSYRVQTRTHTLVEFPASTIRLAGLTLPVAGGFYARTIPGALTRWAIRRLNAEGIPAIVYVHPWELDTGQRYSRVTPRERVTHYHGRRGLEAKLRHLFRDFEFGPLRDLLDLVDHRVACIAKDL